jgi:hypothetical protein
VSDDCHRALDAADAIELVDRAAEEGVPIPRVSGVSTTDTAVELPITREGDFSSPVRDGHGCSQGADTLIREQSALGSSSS